MRVRDLMTADVVSLSGSDRLISAEELMGLRRIRHLPVLDEAGCLEGLVTHRDVMAACLSSIKTNTEWVSAQILKARVNVADIMHTRIQTIGPDEDLATAAERMHQHKFGCLPVVDDAGRVIGIITESDFLRMSAHLLRTLDDEVLEGALRQLA